MAGFPYGFVWLILALLATLPARATEAPMPSYPDITLLPTDRIRDLRDVLGEFRPTRIFVSHPADYHGDHQSLYLFTQVALWQLDAQPAPAAYPYLVHFPHWPDPHGLHGASPLLPPAPRGIECVRHASYRTGLFSNEGDESRGLAVVHGDVDLLGPQSGLEREFQTKPFGEVDFAGTDQQINIAATPPIMQLPSKT